MVVLVVLGAVAMPVRASHTFHASLAQVEFNESSKKVEIAIRVFVDDLEEALTRQAGRRVRLDTTSNVDALALSYVTRSIRIETAQGAPVALTWIGKEPSVDVVWIYVEGSASESIENGRLRYAAFFELFDDQVNTVNIKAGKRRATLTFSTGDGAKPIVLSGDG